MDSPLVSIIIPVYNQKKYIKECVESIISQKYKNLEIIAVDDGSTDSTPKILKEFGKKVLYIRQDNQGAAIAINNGLKIARGDFIGWLGSDDAYLPDFIDLQIRKFQEDPSISLVYTDFEIIDSEGREIKTVRCPFYAPEQMPKRLLMGNFINGSSVIVRRECYDKAGCYDESLKASGDGDMWYRLLKHGYKFGHIPIPLVKYRWHRTNTSHEFVLMQKYRDIVQLRAFEGFTDRNFFTGPEEYEQLSYAFARQFSFKAASAAIKKADEKKFLLKHLFLGVMFNIMSGKFSIALLDFFIKIWKKITSFQ